MNALKSIVMSFSMVSGQDSHFERLWNAQPVVHFRKEIVLLSAILPGRLTDSWDSCHETRQGQREQKTSSCARRKMAHFERALKAAVRGVLRARYWNPLEHSLSILEVHRL